MAAHSLDEAIISGPYHLFDGSFILEFLQPDPSLTASVLMRARWPVSHPLNKLKRSHPQAPPYHLHFNQSETFQVLQGSVGTTTEWACIDRVWTAADEPHEITPWMPHCFWPDPNSTEDSILLVWAHPDQGAELMDRLFFENLLKYIGDVHEGKARMNPFQVMLSQHVTATALIWFPTVTWLGPLRWWVPWKVQAAFAAVGRLMGLTPLMKKYIQKEDWEKYQRLKKD